MPELTERIRATLEERYPTRDLAETAAAVARTDSNVLCTWVDAVSAAGRTPPDWCLQLQELWKRRQGRYADLGDLLAPAGPLSILKGAAIGRLYPAGLMRGQGDLDVAVRGDLWSAGRALGEVGFTPDNLVLAGGADGSTAALVHFARRHGDQELTDHVDLASAPWTGDLRTTGPTWSPLSALAEADRQLLLVAAERWERPFGVRDLVDVAVLTEAGADARRPETARAAHRLGVGPAVRELVRAAATAELIDRAAAAVPRTPAREALRLRAVRLAAGPVRTLEARYVYAGRRAAVGRLVNLLLHRTDARSAVRRGLLAFGVPDGPPRGAGPPGWVDPTRYRTPVGEFRVAARFLLD